MEGDELLNYLKEIHDLLKQNKYNVFFPGIHKGECTEPYIVVKNGGALDSFIVSSDRPIYELLCYVPTKQYSSMVSFVFGIKKTMKKMYPALEYAGNETDVVYDETVKGWMQSFMYQGVRKIEYF